MPRLSSIAASGALALFAVAVVAVQANGTLRAAAEETPVATAAAALTSPSGAHHEILAVALAAAVIFVAAGGGIGGGGVLDPIYILILGLDPKRASRCPASRSPVEVSELPAVANFILNVRRTRRNSSHPVIGYDLILVMQPNLLLGATVGTFVNRIAPSWLLCVLLVGLVVVTSYRTLQKAIRVGKKETWTFLGRGGNGGGVQGDAASLLSKAPSTTVAEQPRVVVPWRKLATLFGLLLTVVLLNLFAGSAATPSIIGLRAGSWAHTVASVLPTIFLLVFTHFAYKNIVAAYHRQQTPGHVTTDEEVKWTPRLLQTFPLVSMLAGAIAGMFGLGGGIIAGPLLLELGVDPTASSANTATIVLVSSLLVSTQFVVQGAVDAALARVLLPVGFGMTLLGNAVLFRAVQRYNCPSLIIFSMAAILIVSTVGMSVESVRALFF